MIVPPTPMTRGLSWKCSLPIRGVVMGEFGEPPWWERFWSKVDATGECWEWAGYGNAQGYGLFRTDVGGSDGCAHRIVWELLIDSIPEGLVMDHLCRNRRCVNPDHLEVVTHKVNIRRGFSLAARRARQTHCIHGHRYTFENTLRNRNGTRRCATCTRRQYDKRNAQRRLKTAQAL